MAFLCGIDSDSPAVEAEEAFLEGGLLWCCSLSADSVSAEEWMMQVAQGTIGVG